ncbi:MAG: endo alpha-1,4 polygalactosaminidase [Hyphomicrobiaceae bacterium]
MYSVPAYRQTSLLRRAIVGIAVLSVSVSATAWLLHATIEPDAEPFGIAANRTPLASVRAWGYQLQRLNVTQAAGSGLDLIVVDPSSLEPKVLEALRRKPNGDRRVVCAYLSVGEAEEVRWYWRREWVAPSAAAQLDTPAPAAAGGRIPKPTAPSWLASTHRDWRGHYRVRFWDAGWQALIFGTPEAALDRILAAGFGCVYLDRADVYALFQKERTTAQADMAAFVARLADYARARAPEILVIVQNAEELLEHAKLGQAIDAVVKEDLLFGLRQAGVENSTADIDASLAYLQKAKRAGLSVFAIEYLDNAAKAAVARRRLSELGFVPYFAPRGLDSLNLEF